MIHAKDLSKEAPRSPYVKVGGFALLGRTIDKCRAAIADTEGDYRFNCPVDRTLFAFAEIESLDFKNFVATGASDKEIGEWVKGHSGLSDEEIHEWSKAIEGNYDYIVEDDEESFS